MKKVFTLILAMTVVFAGFAQVKSVSKNVDKKNVATMKVTKGMESFENVQIEPNMMRTDGELDLTAYDWQTNASIINRTIVWPDNKVNFAFTYASDASSFSDRGTAIGTYDYNNDEWIPCNGRIEDEKTGFGSIARYGENGIVVAAHTATQCGFYIIPDKDNITPNSVPCVLRMDPTVDPSWPVVMTSGPNRDIIHIIATGYADNRLYYWRSLDGQTWDCENVVLPFLTEEYASDFGSNVAHWMETTEDNCLAFVISNAWSDCMVCYSYDDGQTWERKVFWHHPGINTTFDSWFMYPRWSSAQWGIDGELYVAYEFNGSTGEPASGSYYPGIGGVAFWSSNMPYYGDGSSLATWGVDPTNPMPPTPGQPFIMDSAYIYEDIYASWWLWSDATHEMWPEYMGYLAALDENGNPEDPEVVTEFNIDDRSLHGSYNSGCVAMPTLCKVPGSDLDLVAVWSAMDENNYDEATTSYYYKLFASYSADGGRTWAPQIQLTTDFMFSFSEFVYLQAAVVGHTLVIAAQADGTPGTYVQDDDPDPSDNLYQGLTFELDDIFPNVGVSVPEVSHNTHMSLYPNPAVDQLYVTLSQNAEIVICNIMGQTVMNVEGHAGANNINISELNAGVYFISAGNDTQKFIVK